MSRTGGPFGEDCRRAGATCRPVGSENYTFPLGLMPAISILRVDSRIAIKIPQNVPTVKDFEYTSYGRRVRGAAPLKAGMVKSFGFMLADKQPGPFRLEVHSITAEYLGKLTDEQRDKVTGMTRRAEHLLGLTRKYLDLARLEGGQLQLTEHQANFASETLVWAVEITRAGCEHPRMQLVMETTEEAVPTGSGPGLMHTVIVNSL